MNHKLHVLSISNQKQCCDDLEKPIKIIKKNKY